MQKKTVAHQVRLLPGYTRLLRSTALAIAFLLSLVWLTSPVTAQLTAENRQWLEGFEPNQRKGEALAFCDFNGDGFDDLAFGMPGHTVTVDDVPLLNAGLVRIFFGGPFGISNNQLARQTVNQGWLDGGEESAGALFGSALAAADFDLDGVCDLAIGIPGNTVNGLVAAGEVVVVYGLAGSGLNGDRADFFDQGQVTGTPATGDRFGSVLAAGVIGDEEHPDLVVGVPNDRVNSQDEAGAVHILFSRSSAGVSVQSNARLTQDTTNVFGFASAGDRFGSALAIGDVTGDDMPDLIIGTPGDLIETDDDLGSVQVIAGGGSGVEIAVETQLFLHQNVDGVLGDGNPGDEFGYALALGDFNGNGSLDLAVGVPGESQFGPNESGAVQIFYGGPTQLSTSGDQVILESSISPEIATFDRFGTTLATGDFNADGFDELVVGYPLDNVFGQANSGNVAVLQGAISGVLTSGAQLWNGFTLLTVEPGDEFGFALAVGSLENSMATGVAGTSLVGSYLAIGVPGREGDGMEAQQGGVMLLRNQVPIFSDDFEVGDTSRWSSSVP